MSGELKSVTTSRLMASAYQTSLDSISSPDQAAHFSLQNASITRPEALRLVTAQRWSVACSRHKRESQHCDLVFQPSVPHLLCPVLL